VILKEMDSKDAVITELNELSASAPSSFKSKIEQELRAVRAGVKGERESAYLIDFNFGKSKNFVVIHDLRLEVDGRVAQIDHLLINRALDVLVLESKHFHAGVKITEEGEFLQWNSWKNTYEGMSSPLAQNDRHIEVLKDAFKRIDMPVRIGLRLAPIFHSYIMVAPNARVVRPKKFNTGNVIKADALYSMWQKKIDKMLPTGIMGRVAKIVSTDTIESIGRQLIALHKPIHINYVKKFGLDVNTTSTTLQQPIGSSGKETPVQKTTNTYVCRACGSTSLSIQYGKYGYYFKCADCGGNTPIKLGCGNDGHKERLRKEGRKFFRECAECGSSTLFFQNPN
jgi:hypothetical protein